MNNLFTTLNDLPMNAILADILAHINTGGVALVASETGSGKSLLTPAAIYADTGESVLICEPSRFLTMNAASIISDITNTKLGEIAGYSVGIRGRESMPTVHRNTPLTFETYGMSLASQSILDAENVVLDEAHDPQMDITIVAAVMKARMQGHGSPVSRLVIMSATMNVEEKLEYWKDFNPKVFTIETGRRFKCNLLWEPATPSHEAIIKLIDAGKTGILVFAPGVGEIQDLASTVFNAIEHRKAADHSWPNDMAIEILQLHGGSEYEDRIRANANPPSNTVRVLIGTNVMESGVSFSWVDAGVSLGLTKEQHVARESGATALHTVPLTRSSLQQQTGRTNRFCDSEFILCGRTSSDQMGASPTPEIMRVPLTSLHMHCASIGVDPGELEFSPSPDPTKFKEAVVVLQHLGFLDDHHKLTEAGDFAQQLPVGLETAALLWRAKQLDILPQALRLAAIMEVGGIRKDLRVGHGLNYVSDHLDGMVAYATAELLQSDKSITHADRVASMEDHNIGKKKFDGAKEVLIALERVLDLKIRTPAKQFVRVQYNESVERYDTDVATQNLLFDKLRQCILSATIDRLGSYGIGGVCMGGNDYMRYGVATSCSVRFDYGQFPVSAVLRRIQPRDPMKLPFTVAEQVTRFELSDFVEFNKVRPDVIRVHPINVWGDIDVRVFGKVFYRCQDKHGIFSDTNNTGVVQRSEDVYLGYPSSLGDTLASYTKKAVVRTMIEDSPAPQTAASSNGTMHDQLAALREKFKGR